MVLTINIILIILILIILFIIIIILARSYMCSLMMISDMLSKHVGAVKSVLKK